MPPLHPIPGRALYRQLADILREQITSGRLQPGDPLPGERHLAAEYGVAVGTVRAASALLRVEGWIERRRGQLWQVRDREEIQVQARPGDVVRCRLAGPDDEAEHGIPEGTPVMVVHRRCGAVEVYRAADAVYQVPRDA